MANAMSLKGKTAIVTGAGWGIGRAIAVVFATHGAHVVLAGRRRAQLEETKADIEPHNGACTVHVTDINDESSVKQLIAKAAAITGRIDVLVNCAGISAFTDVANDADGKDWSAIIETNLNAVYRCIRLALPHVPDGGRIINIASVLAHRAAPKSAAYVASKHGLIGLTKSLALDLAPRHITVNAISPGWVDTDMARDIIDGIAAAEALSADETKARITQRIPMQRMVEAEEVAATTLFLAGPGGAAITGQAITVCAGSSLV